MNIKLNDNVEFDILKKHEFPCGCGRTHKMNIDEILIGPDMIEKIPETAEKYELGKRVLVVTDKMISDLYGDRLKAILEKAELEATYNIFMEKAVLPDEMALAKMLLTMEKGTQWILAVGSGAVNDLCRYLSFKLEIPYVSVPTAASMDGYTADSSLLILNGLKQTVKATYPKIVIGDTTILKGTPQILLAAGFGDLTAKITAGADWELAHIVKGDYYCDTVERIVLDAVDRSIAVAEGLAKNDETAAGTLFEGLMITGMPMHWTGMSNPLAGAEHHLTHFWGMKAVAEGRRPHMHGIEVAQGIALMMKVYKEFLNMDLSDVDIDKVVAAQTDKAEWEAEIAEHFGDSAQSVYDENANMSFDEAEVREEVEFILSHMDEIKKAVSAHLAPYENIPEILAQVGCITNPSELGFTSGQIHESICYAHFVRKKYTILRMLSRLGCLEQIADKVVSEIEW